MASFAVTNASLAWTSGGETALLAGSEARATLNINAPDLDATVFGSSVAFNTFLNNIYDWSIDVESQFSPALTGSMGSFAWASSNYATNVRSWALDFVTAELDATVFSPTVAARTFRPGLTAGTGSFEAFQDDTTPITLPSTAAAGTFMVNDATNDYKVEADCFATQVGVTNNIGEMATVAYALRISDASIAFTSASSTWANQFVTSGNLAAPTTGGTLRLTSATSRTFTGEAFRTRLAITCPVDGLVTVQMRFRGTGALTIA